MLRSRNVMSLDLRDADPFSVGVLDSERAMEMDARKLFATVALTGMLVVGGAGAATAAGPNQPDESCFGQHVSMMAREHGGMAKATAHHNEMHGTNYTVAEHLAHMRSMGCEMEMD
jgi:hypothetical protein